MSKKPKKPKPPEQIMLEAAQRRAAEREAAKNPENWGADPKALSRQPDVTMIMARRNVVQTAQRDDVFNRLMRRDGLREDHYQAARRLESDMLERRGEGNKSAQGEYIDGRGSRELVTQRMMEAGTRVDAVLAVVGIRNAALLKELIEPRQVLVDREVDRWRQVVTVLAGEANPHAQAAVVRAACDNLMLAYQQVDSAPRAAA